MYRRDWANFTFPAVMQHLHRVNILATPDSTALFEHLVLSDYSVQEMETHRYLFKDNKVTEINVTPTTVVSSQE